MNRLSVEWRRITNQRGNEYYALDWYIDGRLLSDLAREFEAPFAEGLAGQYASLWSGSYTEEFMLGKQPEYGEREDKTGIIDCECGGPGCWPLAARIRVDGDRVIWEDFEQPHRDWSYAGFGPFIFELDKYLKVVRGIPPPLTPTNP